MRDVAAALPTPTRYEVDSLPVALIDLSGGAAETVSAQATEDAISLATALRLSRLDEAAA